MTALERFGFKNPLHNDYDVIIVATSIVNILHIYEYMSDFKTDRDVVK